MSTYCEVNMNTSDCMRPVGAQWADPIRTRCFRCGGPCCKACSALVTDGGRRRRVCADCLETERGEIDVPADVAARLGLTAPEPRTHGLYLPNFAAAR